MTEKKKTSKKAPAKKTSTKKASPRKLNAAQKLEALENLVMGMQTQINILAEEVDKVGEFVQLVGKRLQASNEVAKIPSESIDKVIIESHVKDLELKTDELVAQNLIKRSDSGEIKDEKCFVIAREIDKDGNELSPRIQFAVMTLVDELKPNFIGKERGSVIKNKHDEGSIEITEVYDIHTPEKDIQFDESVEGIDEQPTP